MLQASQMSLSTCQRDFAALFQAECFPVGGGWVCNPDNASSKPSNLCLDEEFLIVNHDLFFLVLLNKQLQKKKKPKKPGWEMSAEPL